MRLIILIVLTLSFSVKATTTESSQRLLVNELLTQIQKAVTLSAKKGLPCHEQFLSDKKLKSNLEVNGIGTIRLLQGAGSPEGNGQWDERYFGTVIAQPPDSSALISLGFFVDINRNDCRTLTKVPAIIKIFSGAEDNVIGSANFEVTP